MLQRQNELMKLYYVYRCKCYQKKKKYIYISPGVRRAQLSTVCARLSNALLETRGSPLAIFNYMFPPASVQLMFQGLERYLTSYYNSSFSSIMNVLKEDEEYRLAVVNPVLDIRASALICKKCQYSLSTTGKKASTVKAPDSTRASA